MIINAFEELIEYFKIDYKWFDDIQSGYINFNNGDKFLYLSSDHTEEDLLNFISSLKETNYWNNGSCPIDGAILFTDDSWYEYIEYDDNETGWEYHSVEEVKERIEENIEDNGSMY